MVRREHSFKPVYTDTPLFTDNQDTIQEYFDCQDDYVPASIACPSSILERLTSGNFSGAVIVWGQPSATESSGIPPLITLLSTRDNGSFFPFGVHTISYKAVDLKNNIDRCEFNVTVVDGVQPRFTNCPLKINQVIDNDNITGSVLVEWDEPTATDNSGVHPTVVNETPDKGPNFTKGTHIITYRARDEAGNSQICTFNVVIAIKKSIDLIGKVATQSSTYRYEYTSDKAIDGNKDTLNHNEMNDPHPWWKVDLEDKHCLVAVTVTLRLNCCGSRFNAATVRAGESFEISENQPCGLPATEAQSKPGAVIVFVCDPPVVARYVSIDIDVTYPSVRDDYLLQIAEVKVEEATNKECE
ncbi:uncharacterized protein [Asterias amurensis]|uniref:uncharacterized protein n=1 Tax=Asterias amurensis TaxID=7602 RepID=UPI003AB5550D